jgi:hypothetical protein
MKNGNLPLLMLFCIFALFAIIGEIDKQESVEQAYNQGYAAGYEIGLRAGRHEPRKCTTKEALKWWTNATDLLQVKRALCSNHKGT